VDLSVGFKLLPALVTRSGSSGACKTNNNYYIVRMNPLEDNFWLYKVQGGKRYRWSRSMPRPEAGKWHTMRAVNERKQNRVLSQRKKLIEHTDDTFIAAGKIGLWTKATPKHISPTCKSRPGRNRDQARPLNRGT